jgi:serine protease Do
MNLLSGIINEKISKMEQNNLNKNSMKGKYLIGGFLMAVAGAFVAIFVYTRLIEKPSYVTGNDTSKITVADARPLLTSLQQTDGQIDFTYAAELTVHAVVSVRTTTDVSGKYNNPIMEYFYGNNSRQREVKGMGSGVIISEDGYIITNNHVVEEADKINVKLNDNREFEAQVIGHDPNTDIALLKIKANNLSFVKYGDSDKLKLGEWVLAVGNPFNLTSTVTAGIVSAKGRNLDILDGSYKIESFIQTDAAVNMGNSGGALVNTNGLLVGITSAILSPSGAYAGNSFAIPVNIVKKIVDDLKQFGEVQRAFIGVSKITDITPDLIEKENLKLDEVRGVYLGEITKGSSADDAGLNVKDVIVKFNGVSVGTVAQLQEQVSKYRPGDKAEVTYIRDGKENSVPIVLKNVDNTTSTVAPGEGAGIVFGARLVPLTNEERSSYRLESGIRVSEVNEGRFKELGIKKGYIIVSVNGKKVNSSSDVKDFTNNGQSLSSIEGYQLNGTFFRFQSGR